MKGDEKDVEVEQVNVDLRRLSMNMMREDLDEDTHVLAS